MIVDRSNFYVVAGGPGSGKTALIDALRARGQLCVDECIRKIIRQQVKIDGYGLHWKDQTIFRELILSWSIEAFESVSERVRPVFFDRGIPELLGDGPSDRPAALKHVQRAAELFRYNSKVFIAPPWEQIYCTDTERIEDFDHAIKAYRATVDIYLKCGYSLIELPCVPPEIRASFVMEQISAHADPESK
jgi:predicted ATPase